MDVRTESSSSREAHSSPEQRSECLTSLLSELYPAEGELRRFLRTGPGGQELDGSLPGTEASRATLISAAVQGLEARGLINIGFFTRLRADRRGRSRDISRVEKLWTRDFLEPPSMDASPEEARAIRDEVSRLQLADGATREARSSTREPPSQPHQAGERRSAFVIAVVFPAPWLRLHAAGHAALMAGLNAVVGKVLQEISARIPSVSPPAMEMHCDGVLLCTELRLPPHWFLGKFQRSLEQAGLHAYIGVSDGRIDLMPGVSGKVHVSGPAVRTAMCLARAPENTGVLILEGLATASLLQLPPPEELADFAARPSNAAAPLLVRDVRAGVLRCRLLSEVCPASHPVPLPELRLSQPFPAFFLAGRLPESGPTEARERQAAFCRLEQHLQASLAATGGVEGVRWTQTLEEVVLILPVVEVDASKRTQQQIMPLALELQKHLELLSRGGQLPEDVRCAVHFGFAQTWQDAEGQSHPAGPALLETKQLIEAYRPPGIAVSTAAARQNDDLGEPLRSRVMRTRGDGPSYFRYLNAEIWVRFTMDTLGRLLQSPHVVSEGGLLSSLTNKKKRQQITATFLQEVHQCTRQVVFDSLMTLLVFLWACLAVWPSGGERPAGDAVVTYLLVSWTVVATLAGSTIVLMGYVYARICGWGYWKLLCAMLVGLEVRLEPKPPGQPVGRMARLLELVVGERCQRITEGNDDPEVRFRRRWSIIVKAAFPLSMFANIGAFGLLVGVLWSIFKHLSQAGDILPALLVESAAWLCQPIRGTQSLEWFRLPLTLVLVTTGTWSYLFLQRLKQLDWSPLYRDLSSAFQSREASTLAWLKYRGTAELGFCLVIATVLTAWWSVRERAKDADTSLYLHLALAASLLVSGGWRRVARSGDHLVTRVLMARGDELSVLTGRVTPYLGPVLASLLWHRTMRQEHEEIVQVIREAARKPFDSAWGVVDRDERLQALSPEAADQLVSPPSSLTELFSEASLPGIRGALEASYHPLASQKARPAAALVIEAALMDGQRVEVVIEAPGGDATLQRRFICWRSC